MKTLNFCALTALICGCAGADGADGTDGRAGENGETPEITTRAASADDCPEGGSEVEIATGDESEVIVICDGEAGEDGAPGAAGEEGAAGEPGADGDPGAAGEPGTDGADGENGAPGADGVDAVAGESIGKIEASLYCGAALEGLPVVFDYWARVFTDGSIWSSGTVDDGLLTAGNSAFFVAEQVGAATAPVTFVFDLQGPGLGGTWTVGLNRETTTVVITYSDTDLAGGQVSWTLPGSSANCVVNEY